MSERRKCRVCHFFHKIGCHGNVPRDIGKRGPDRSSAPKTLSFGEKIVKIGPVDTEILYFGEINKKDKKEEKKEITEGKIYSPVGHLAKQANDIRQTVQNTYM